MSPPPPGIFCTLFGYLLHVHNSERLLGRRLVWVLVWTINMANSLYSTKFCLPWETFVRPSLSKLSDEAAIYLIFITWIFPSCPFHHRNKVTCPVYTSPLVNFYDIFGVTQPCIIYQIATCKSYMQWQNWAVSVILGGEKNDHVSPLLKNCIGCL